MTAKLQLVTKPAIPIPFDDTRGKRRIEALRSQLLAAAVRYVNEVEDKEGCKRPDRIRIASDKSGIPRVQIEIESAR